jgi:tetratricopeptide (TPR) repeat protein
MYQCSEGSLRRALQSLAQGVETYGENPVFYAAMGLVHLQLHNSGFGTAEETLMKAEGFLDRITALDPESSCRYHLLGLIERSRGRTQLAVRSLKKAVDLDPNEPDTLGWLGNLLSLNMGRPDLGRPYIKRLIEIDPLVAWNYSAAAAYYLAKGRTDRALEMIRRSVQMDPADRNFRVSEAWHLAWNGLPEESLALIDRIVTERADDRAALSSSLLKFALQQEKEKAVQALTGQNREILWNDPEGPRLMADVFALLKERNEAFAWLERAAARGWINYPLFSRIDPFLANIRGERRFKKLMERVKHEWEQFEL